MKVVTVLGTRPELVKLSDYISLMDEYSEHTLIHTGQHYDYEMDAVFFKELNLRQPDLNLNVGSHSHAKQTALMLEPIEKTILEKKPDFVVSLGDTNSTLAAALVSKKLKVPFVHLEAGCRSFTNIPEEINRVIADHSADILIAPTKKCLDFLKEEGLDESKMHFVGDYVFDAVQRNLQLSDFNKLAESLGLQKDNYILTTLHRAEHTDEKEVLEGLFQALDQLAEKMPVIYPMHPRAKKTAEQFNLSLKNVKVIPPLGYLDLLAALNNAKFSITDSGGVQKESVAMNTPCLITRDITEWMEPVHAQKNFLVGNQRDGVLRAANNFISNPGALEEVKQRPFEKDGKPLQKAF